LFGRKHFEKAIYTHIYVWLSLKNNMKGKMHTMTSYTLFPIQTLISQMVTFLFSKKVKIITEIVNKITKSRLFHC